MLKKIFFIGTYCAIASVLCAQPNNSDSALTNKAIAPIQRIPKTNKIETDYEKSLWKFNLLGAVKSGLDVSYERKIAPKWSININSVTNARRFSPPLYSYGILDRYSWNRANFTQTLALQVRYYHNLERRKRLGKNTQFSGNYFALEASTTYDKYHNYMLAQYSLPTSGNTVFYSVNLLYGIQRKIGKRGYIDTSVGIGLKSYQTMYGYSGTFISPSAKIGVGLAF